ncbi:MAG: GntR family transcriptional regulator [Acidobacteriota bacterium]
MNTLAEAAPKVLQRESLSKRVADSLRAAILNGEYQLGQKLREVELSKSYGVSNSVIREAFHILQGEGIVVTDPYRGRSVFNIEAREARELILMRTSLEALAAYLAAENPEAASKAKISQVAREMKSFRPRAFADWAELDLEFHRSVWKAAGNELLARQLNHLSVISLSLNTLHFFKPQAGFNELLRIMPTWEKSENIQGHQLLARSIVNGHPQEARKQMILHIMGDPAYRDLRRQFFQV